MYIIDKYPVAVVFCLVTMLCWGSWQTLRRSRRRIGLFRCSIGIIPWALLLPRFCSVDNGEHRPLLEEALWPICSRPIPGSLFSAFIGGVVFNLSNLLVVAAISVAGLSIAFPIGVGLALVIGVVVNYIKQPVGDPLLLFAGVLLVVVAIVVNGAAASKVAGVENFFPPKEFSCRSLAESSWVSSTDSWPKQHDPELRGARDGRLTPYSGVLVFSVCVFISNFVWEH